MSTTAPKCPLCDGPLNRVLPSPGSTLNRGQFDLLKGGDWYCGKCPGNGRGRVDHRYYWDREIEEVEEAKGQPSPTLIAAAPLILLACREVRDRLKAGTDAEGGIGPMIDLHSSLIATLDAAIGRATGTRAEDKPR